jgi:uridine phosphorylase
MSLLTHYDDAKIAIINPEDFIKKLENFPKIAIATFTDRVLDEAFKDQDVEIITYLHGNTLPVYKLNYQGIDIALIVSKTGAAASVVGAESLIALGAEELIYYGSCGVLDRTIGAHNIVIPTHAIRDEGTSYHYIKASDEIELDRENIKLLTNLLEDLELPYYVGKTWTTDAIFRETRKKFDQRKEQGSIVVEMECSALAAVTQFRGVSFTQFLYAADNLDADQWDPRIIGKKVSKEELYLLVALEYAVALTKRGIRQKQQEG